MSLHHEVLEHLSDDENKPMTSGQLYELCKGADTSAIVSTALSQLFNQGRIKRKVSPTGSGGLYLYWKNPEQSQSETKAVPAAVSEAQGTEENGDLQHKYSSPSLIAGVVDNLMNAMKPAADAAEIVAAVNHNEPPTINLKARILLPTMPTTLKVAGLKPATLDDAFASGGDFVVDVGTLDEAAVEQVIQRWGVEFRAHAEKLRVKHSIRQPLPR